MGLELAAQREQKQTRLKAALARGGFEATPELVAGDALAYRGRARFGFARGTLGVRRARSHELVDVPRCAVLDPRLQAAWDLVRERVGPELQGHGEIQLALRDDQAVVALRTEDDQPPALYRALESLLGAQVAGASLTIGDTAPAYLPGEREARERAPAPDGVPLEGSVAGFSQAHVSLNAAMVERVARWADPGGAHLLELFCGHGNLTMALAARGPASYRAVELDAGAIARLHENAARRGLAVDAVAGDANAEAVEGAEVLVLDPPRIGALPVAERVAAARRPPSRIVYVSCDHHTLGRDLEVLRPVGYSLLGAAVFDMFPQTPHLESVVWLERA